MEKREGTDIIRELERNKRRERGSTTESKSNVGKGKGRKTDETDTAGY